MRAASGVFTVAFITVLTTVASVVVIGSIDPECRNELAFTDAASWDHDIGPAFGNFNV
jgi:hypothetical protein